MSLNPAKVVYDDGKGIVLGLISTTDGLLDPDNAKVKLVQSVVVDAGDRTVSSIVYGIEGLQTAVALGSISNYVTSESGKVYINSDLLTFTLAAPTGPQTIVGATVENALGGAAIIAYTEFDTPITIDEDGETIKLILEVGFDEVEIYYAMRVVPLGE